MTMEEAILLFEISTPKECSECYKAHDFTCSGADARRCEAYRMAIAALREPKLPCKPGDTVYRLCGQKGRKYVAERKVVSVALCGEQSWQILTTAHDWLGHNVFLTREEAEAKLRRLEEV